MADSIIHQETEGYAYSKAQTDALIAQSTATKQDIIEVKSVEDISSNLVVLRGGYYKIGKLVVLNVVFRPTSGTWTADTALFGVPDTPYQANAPLLISTNSANPNFLSGNPRIASGYVRPGVVIGNGIEYVIQGTYFVS